MSDFRTLIVKETIGVNEDTSTFLHCINETGSVCRTSVLAGIVYCGDIQSGHKIKTEVIKKILYRPTVFQDFWILH